MRVAFGAVDATGQSFDLRNTGVDAGTVLEAVRDPSDDRVVGAPPRAVHERVGFLHRGVSVRVPAAVADAARSRGARTEYDRGLGRVEAELAALDAPSVDLEAARERVADAAADVDALREQVARASGRVEAARDAGRDASGAEEALRAVNRELADAETDHHAALEALAAARDRARSARDTRERRLALEDRRENLRRDARRALVDEYGESFRRALRALPVPGSPAAPREFDGPDVAAACAVARLARPGAPLVVAGDVFGDASRARAALDAPVLLVEV
ncbi:DUF7856 family protein [Halobacterium litoreum]|uniref:Uncharacterized protein n=1 Tax=Halobacterium litoreum TaxID=2039234 RepID=A0ABD5NED3_9EURY|nr:hypothetical protein [Halobacterium litoreum]UHH13485.1 hypothetical protein LT972_00470 [Halobacterium litoreum]